VPPCHTPFSDDDITPLPLLICISRLLLICHATIRHADAAVACHATSTLRHAMLIAAYADICYCWFFFFAIIYAFA